MRKDNFFNFTKQAIEKITGPKFTKNKKGKIIRPEIVQHIYRDSIVKGLALHVSYKGTKSFFLHKTTKGVRYDTMLGIFPSMSVEQARCKAEELKKQIVTTDNISQAASLTVIPIKTAANNDSEMTFKQLLDKARNHARIKEYRSWEKEYPLLEKRTEQIHDEKLSTITANDIQEICNNCLILEHPNPRFTGKVAANRCLSKLRSIFNTAIKWEWDGKNPTRTIAKYGEQPRDRYLSSEEIDSFCTAVKEESNPTIRDAIFMHIYTAARTSNVKAMRWETVSLVDKTWHIYCYETNSWQYRKNIVKE